MPSTLTTTVAVGSFTVPVNSGVLSLVNTSLSATVGATASTTAVAGPDVLPAGSSVTAVTVSSSFKPGFGTVHVPSGPATTLAVLPSG